MIDAEAAFVALRRKAAGKSWLSLTDIEAVLSALPSVAAGQPDTVRGLNAQDWCDTAARYFQGLGAIAHTDNKAATVDQHRAIALFYRGEGPLVEHVVRNADGTLTVLRPSPDDPAPAPPRRTPLSDAASGNP